MDGTAETLGLLQQYPEIIYGLSVCLLTWIILQYLLHKPTKIQKFITLFSSGVCLGIVYYFIVQEIRWPMMILGFLASIGFYELIIKLIMKKFNLSYGDK